MAEYIKIARRIEMMIVEGTNGCDPVIRAMYRQLEKLYKRMNKADRNAVDWWHEMQAEGLAY